MTRLRSIGVLSTLEGLEIRADRTPRGFSLAIPGASV